MSRKIDRLVEIVSGIAGVILVWAVIYGLFKQPPNKVPAGAWDDAAIFEAKEKPDIVLTGENGRGIMFGWDDVNDAVHIYGGSCEEVIDFLAENQCESEAVFEFNGREMMMCYDRDNGKVNIEPAMSCEEAVTLIYKAMIIWDD